MAEPDAYFTINKLHLPQEGLYPGMHRDIGQIIYQAKAHVERHIPTANDPHLRWASVAELYGDDQTVHVAGYLHAIPGVGQTDLHRLLTDFFTSTSRRITHPRALEVYLDDARLPDSGMADYLLKGRIITAMGVTEAEAIEAMRQYKTLNGNLVVHTSRRGGKFFRDPGTGAWITQTEACSLALEEWHQRRAELREREEKLREDLGYGHNLKIG